MQIKKENSQRSTKAQSLVELLIGTLMFSAVATVMLSIYSINSRELSSFYNKGDVIVDATDAIHKIGVLVRTARGFGDNYGINQPVYTPLLNFAALQSGNPALKASLGINTQVLTGNILNGTGFLVSPSFPSQGDPYYYSGNNAVCPGSVYGGTFPWGNAPSPYNTFPYTLSQDTVVMQVPVFVGNNPGGLGITQTQDPGGAQAPYVWPATYDGRANQNKAGPLQAVDTFVFKVLPDPNATVNGQVIANGIFMLQEAAFPANPAGAVNPGNGGGNYDGVTTNVRLGLTTPLTLTTGIVGPLDAGGNPSIFSYVEKVNGTSTTTPPAAGVDLTNYNGLIVNLEVLKATSGTKAQVAHFKTEFFLRNNAQLVLEGPPQS